MFPTIEGEVTKDSREQVHDKHGHDGNISNTLHAFLGGAARRKKNLFLNVPFHGEMFSVINGMYDNLYRHFNID